MELKKADLNLISVFLEVYRLRSITLASEALNLTQPAVSNALKRFRDQVGQELFIRDGRGISPTSTADFLAKEFSPLIKRINATFLNLEEFDINNERTFNVLVTEPISYLLSSVLPSKSRFGNCRIRFTLAPNSQEKVMKLLSLRKFDVAIDVAECTHSSFINEPFHQDELVVLCSKKHPRIGDSLSKEDYLKEEHIAVKLKRNGLHVAEFFSSQVVAGRKVAFECDSVLGIFAYVELRNALGFTMASMANQYAEKFNLKSFPAPFSIQPVSHFLTYHSSLKHDPAQQWLVKTLHECIRQLPVNTQ
ncbi:LysR family transcriptional regulator [Vibrio vulnificus]|uniref:LysR family transcriptional regulator n=1 Tax=Vibrio vulnificus TaxID=672 RepID=UPI0005FA9B11|nr:LysR family transcriptional regulator [Vibrio vulnificus]EGR1511200.1 LysR family transcriptional regulator [Vibrio vulnificus]EHY9869104.1 LysR family transcriptional regulator [Vibrio vulnificus]EIC2759126.1 LysR family transcriptional regulator [Vibrio vulnificus]EIV1851817.1 LysR family transcriptional regulator [Vibrio vulnificus]ELS0752574.1 LysR family transcriptional regulator [Vibrio vulnificus]